MSAGVARRMFFVQRHIAQQGRTAIGAFDQVVAENRVLGKVAAALLEGIDVVDPLADERAFAEQILIDVRDDARVRIDARIAGDTVARTAIAAHWAG